MREVESCFQRLEQRYALFTSGPARADRFLERVSPAPADVVRTTLFSVDSKAKNRPAHRKADTTLVAPLVARLVPLHLLGSWPIGIAFTEISAADHTAGKPSHRFRDGLTITDSQGYGFRPQWFQGQTMRPAQPHLSRPKSSRCHTTSPCCPKPRQ